MVRIVNGMIVAEGSTTSVQDEASTPLFENRSSTSGFGQSTVDVFGFQLPSYVVAGGSLLVLFWFGFKGLLLGGLLYVLYKRSTPYASVVQVAFALMLTVGCMPSC